MATDTSGHTEQPASSRRRQPRTRRLRSRRQLRRPLPRPRPAASRRAPACRPVNELISIDDFMKVELRVAKVLAAERVPKSKKLLKLLVDTGADQRTIVAGHRRGVRARGARRAHHRHRVQPEAGEADGHRVERHGAGRQPGRRQAGPGQLRRAAPAGIAGPVSTSRCSGIAEALRPARAGCRPARPGVSWTRTTVPSCVAARGRAAPHAARGAGLRGEPADADANAAAERRPASSSCRDAEPTLATPPSCLTRRRRRTTRIVACSLAGQLQPCARASRMLSGAATRVRRGVGGAVRRRRADPSRVVLSGRRSTSSNALLPAAGRWSSASTGSGSRFIIPHRPARAGVRRGDRPSAAADTANGSRCRQDESFTVEYVTDKSWSGYNWYKGEYRSLIQVNTDLPIYIDRAVDLAATKAIPAITSTTCCSSSGWCASAAGWSSPSTRCSRRSRCIAEGTANFGIEVAFPGRVAGPVRARRADAAGRPARRARPTATTRSCAWSSRLSYAGNEAARRYWTARSIARPRSRG